MAAWHFLSFSSLDHTFSPPPPGLFFKCVHFVISSIYAKAGKEDQRPG